MRAHVEGRDHRRLFGRLRQFEIIILRWMPFYKYPHEGGGKTGRVKVNQ